MSDLVATIETLAANALPVKHLQRLDGWRLRYNDGVTRRANSVLAEVAGVLPLPTKLARAEAFYAELNTVCRFQICPASQPGNLDAVLDAQGYLLEPGADVQIAKVRHLTGGGDARDGVSLLQAPDLAWLRVYEAVEWSNAAAAARRREMLETMSGELAFVLVRRGDEPAGVGLGVFEADFVGIFNMATHPAFRRRGVATQVLLSLAHWARAKGAERLYLQVASGNEAAKTAYERFGFTTLYSYHYRVQDVKSEKQEKGESS